MSALRVLPLAQKLLPTATELSGTSKPQAQLGSCRACKTLPLLTQPQKVTCWCHCCAFDVGCLLLSPSFKLYWVSTALHWIQVNLWLLRPCHTPTPKAAWPYASNIAHRGAYAKQLSNVDSSRGLDQRTNSNAMTWVPLHAKVWYIIIEKNCVLRFSFSLKRVLS